MPVDVLIERDSGVAEPYPAPPWLLRPNRDNLNSNRISYFSQVMTSLLADGNTFVLLIRDNSYDVREVRVQNPLDVEIRDGRYRVRGRSGFTEYDSEEMLHIPLIQYAGEERGISPLEAARQIIGLGLAEQEYRAHFFTQDATPPLVINVPAGVRVDEEKDRKSVV